jgi:hypothetical protein
MSGSQDFSVCVVTRLRTGRPRNRVRSPAVTISFLSSNYPYMPSNPTKLQTTGQRKLEDKTAEIECVEPFLHSPYLHKVFAELSKGKFVAFKYLLITFSCNVVYSLRTVRVADLVADVKPWTSHVRSSADHSSVIFVWMWPRHVTRKSSVTKHMSPASIQILEIHLHAFSALLCHGAQSSFMLIVHVPKTCYNGWYITVRRSYAATSPTGL